MLFHLLFLQQYEKPFLSSQRFRNIPFFSNVKAVFLILHLFLLHLQSISLSNVSLEMNFVLGVEPLPKNHSILPVFAKDEVMLEQNPSLNPIRNSVQTSFFLIHISSANNLIFGSQAVNQKKRQKLSQNLPLIAFELELTLEFRCYLKYAFL